MHIYAYIMYASIYIYALTMALKPSLMGSTPGLDVDFELIGTNTRHFLALGHLCMYMHIYAYIMYASIYICALTMALKPSLMGSTPGLGVDPIGTTRRLSSVRAYIYEHRYAYTYNMYVYIYVCAYNGSESFFNRQHAGPWR